jgi:hypothetical protein
MKRSIALLMLLTLMISCNTKTDIAKEEKQIRDLLQHERKAHFDRNMELLI